MMINGIATADAAGGSTCASTADSAPGCTAEARSETIKVGYIQPLRAEYLNLGTPEPPAFEASPQIAGLLPLRATPETIAHAREVAGRFVATLAVLPETQQAADVLSLALAVLHFTRED